MSVAEYNLLKKKFPCPVCKKGFVSYDSLRVHSYNDKCSSARLSTLGNNQIFETTQNNQNKSEVSIVEETKT